jgi:hypothetical protein
MKLTTPIISAFLLFAVLASCRKDEAQTPLPDRDRTAATDNLRSEHFFADLVKQGDLAYKNGVGGCILSVTIDMDTMPHTMLVDLGPENCMGTDGVSRRGRLLVTFTGPYGEQGTVITIIPENYHVNDHLIQGVKTVTNAGNDGDGNIHFDIAVNGTITAPDGSWTSTHQHQRTRTWVAGAGTAVVHDDVYLITGGGSGIDRNGRPYTVSITTPLRVEMSCPWIVSGVQQVVPQGLPARIIDHGNGTCDAAASITVGGFTFNIGV